MANLHRSSKIPDWEKIDPKDRNPWQNVAAATRGVVTPGNGISVAGLGLVLSGINDARKGNNGKATIKVAAGRLLDIADGFVADKTGTKSSKGEGLDAGIDKVEIALGLPVMYSKDIIPTRVAVMTGAQNIANVALTAVAKKRGVEIHPSSFGKKATTAQWSTIGLYSLSGIARGHQMQRTANVLESGAKIAELAATTLGVAATVEYALDAFAHIPDESADPDAIVYEFPSA